MEEDREDVLAETSKSPLCPKNFRREGTVADLEFLRDTRVVCMVSLAPPAEEEEKGEVNEGEEGGPGCFFSFVFLLFFFFSVLSGRFWDEGDKGALL